MKVLIAGGGIGGLTTALCCLHHGHDVTVFEQAPAFDEVGAGIQLPPNAMKVFEALGVDSVMAEKAFEPEAIEARMGETGRTLFTIPLAEQSIAMWGSPYLHIHRADYIAALRDALLNRALYAVAVNAKVTAYTQDREGVTVTLENGRQFSGDVLIGADGIKSSIRDIMLGPDDPVFTGNMAWRAVVPIEALGAHLPNPTACVWMGKGRHAVTYRLRKGQLANFVGVVERDDWAEESSTEENWTEQGRRKDAMKDFAGWHPVITKLIENVPESALYRWALFDRKPLPRWTDGRVALLGDAAHPMLPFLAQGAAMAVEDAWIIAHELSQSGQTVSTSLNAYQARRFDRTSRAQAGSRANMKTFHQRTKTGQIKTYGSMWLGGRLAPRLVHKRMNWLYGYDVTAG